MEYGDEAIEKESLGDKNKSMDIENEEIVDLLKSSIFLNSNKQKVIINNLRKENNNIKYQLKLLQKRNEELQKMNIEKDKQLEESVNQISKFLTNVEETKIAFEKSVNFYEDKIIKLVRQFEIKMKEMHQLHRKESEKIRDNQEFKDQEILKLTAEKQELNIENENMLHDIQKLNKLIFESKDNLKYKELFKRITDLKEENIKLIKKNQFQDFSIMQLINKIKELQSNVKFIDIQFSNVRNLLTEESNTNILEDFRKSSQSNLELCLCAKKKMKDIVKTSKEKGIKEINQEAAVDFGNQEWIYEKSMSKELKPLPSDLEKEIYRLKKATYHCIEFIKQDLKH